MINIYFYIIEKFIIIYFNTFLVLKCFYLKAIMEFFFSKNPFLQGERLFSNSILFPPPNYFFSFSTIILIIIIF